jgi:hypothetical protein
MRGIGWSLADERALSSRERGLLRQGSGTARQTLGFVRQTYGFVRQTYGFVRQTFGFVRQTFGFVRQTFGFVRQTFGFVRQTFGFVRQTFGFDLKSRVFTFFPSETSEISNFIMLPVISESSPCASTAGRHIRYTVSTQDPGRTAWHWPEFGIYATAQSSFRRICVDNKSP